MANELTPKIDVDQVMVYQIKTEGHLSPQWVELFGEATITLEENGASLLTCPVVDQAALHGLLRKVRDLGLPLISVNRIESGQAEMPNVYQHHSKKENRNE